MCIGSKIRWQIGLQLQLTKLELLPFIILYRSCLGVFSSHLSRICLDFIIIESSRVIGFFFLFEFRLRCIYFFLKVKLLCPPVIFSKAGCPPPCIIFFLLIKCCRVLPLFPKKKSYLQCTLLFLSPSLSQLPQCPSPVAS